MPTITIDLALIAAYTGLVFFGGWQVESWHNQAHQGKELQASIVVKDAEEKHVGDIATGYETTSQQSRLSQAALMDQWSDLNAKPHAACELSAGDLSLLKSATTSDHLPR